MAKNRFRHEFKFLVSLEDAENFFVDAMPYCDYDPHSGDTKSYEIASTYYDTEKHRFYIDREESVGYRRKIRLRSYNTDGDSTALFVEIKEKHQAYVNKKRINLKSSTLLDEGIPHNEIPLERVIEDLEDSAEAREISYLHSRLDLKPVVIIRYIRKALIPKFEEDMRITLDTKISAGGTSLSAYDKDQEKFVIDPGFGVLEVKSNSSIPLWIQSAMRRYSFVQTRYSKYCLGVDVMFNGSKPWLPTTSEITNQAGASDPAKVAISY